MDWFDQLSNEKVTFDRQDRNKQKCFGIFCFSEKVCLLFMFIGFTWTWQFEFLEFLVSAQSLSPISDISIRAECLPDEELVTLPYYGTETICFKFGTWRVEACATETDDDKI